MGVLRWVVWWHSTEALTEDVGSQKVRDELNTDFEAGMLGAKELQALVSAWQSSAISRDTLFHHLRPERCRRRRGQITRRWS